jgi:hypothetical protein
MQGGGREMYIPAQSPEDGEIIKVIHIFKFQYKKKTNN